MDNRWWDLTVLGSDVDNLVRRPKTPIACREDRASVSFT